MASPYDPDTGCGWEFECGLWTLWEDDTPVRRQYNNPFPEDEHECNDWLADYDR